MVLQSGQSTPCYDADFDPFGGEHIVTNTCPQNYKFTGKERDSETGLDNFEARYYSSQFGRFHSADWSAVPVPVPYADLGNPQTLNLYAYVKNNPLNLTDPTGHIGLGGFHVGVQGDARTIQVNGLGLDSDTGESWFSADFSSVNSEDNTDTGPAQAQQQQQVQSPQAQSQNSGGFWQKFGNFLKGNGWKTNEQVIASQRQWLSANRIVGISAEGKEISVDWSKASAQHVASAYAYVHDVMAAANANHLLSAIGIASTVAFSPGHGARHLAGTGLNQAEVEAAIRREIQTAVKNTAQSTGNFWGRVSVGGKTIEYRAFTLPNGTINVGTYYIP